MAYRKRLRSTVIDRRVFSGKKGTVCNRCHHERVSQPYIEQTSWYKANLRRSEIVCWRCVHDYDGVFAIKAKYGDFLTIEKRGPWWYLELAESMQTFLELGYAEQ